MLSLSFFMPQMLTTVAASSTQILSDFNDDDGFLWFFMGPHKQKKTFSYSNLWRAYRVWMHYKKWNTISENKFHVCEMYCVLAYRVPKKMQTDTSYCVCTGFPSFRFGTTAALNTLYSNALYASVQKWEKWLTNFVRRATKKVYK